MNKIKFGIGFFTIMIAGIATAVLLYTSYFLNNSNAFLPGVKIGGIDVKGLTVEEAGAVIDKRFASVLNSTLDFYWQDFIQTLTLKDICDPIKGKNVAAEVWDQEQVRPWYKKIGSFKGSTVIDYPIKLNYHADKLEQIGQEWEKKWDTAAENARLQVDSAKGLQVIAEKKGIKVDISATFEQLPDRVENIRSPKYKIITQTIDPTITSADLSNMGKLASYTTWYNPGLVDRSHNLYQAAVKINGYMVKTQGTFSFNEVVGKRDLENDFRDALVIVNGKYESGMGGGICQVSSTLYNAVLLAGLDIVERHNHALAVAYVPLGRDATVAYGLQDFKFKNNTDGSIYLQSYTKNGELTVTVFGDLGYKQKIDITNMVDQVNEFKVVEEVDPKLKPGTKETQYKGVPGYVVRAFRNFYDGNGSLLKQQLLSKDVYRPLDELVYVGPKPADKPVADLPADPVDTGKPAESDQPSKPDATTGDEPVNNSEESPLHNEDSDLEKPVPENVEISL